MSEETTFLLREVMETLGKRLTFLLKSLYYFHTKRGPGSPYWSLAITLRRLLASEERNRREWALSRALIDSDS
jgi:hypothetical protein